MQTSFKGGYLRIFPKHPQPPQKAYKSIQNTKINLEDNLKNQLKFGAIIPKETGESGFKELIVDLRNNTKEQIAQIIKFIRKNSPNFKIKYSNENYPQNLTPKGQLGFEKTDAKITFNA